MYNMKNMLLFHNYYSSQSNKIYGPIWFYKDKIGYFLDLNLKLKDFDQNQNELSDDDKNTNFNFRIYDWYINNIILMNKEIANFILSNWVWNYHCSHNLNENWWIFVDIPLCQDENHWNVFKMINWIYYWMYWYYYKKTTGKFILPQYIKK